MTSDELSASTELYQLALAKTSKVLGPDHAKQLMDQLLKELGIDLQTPNDLLRLSEVMSHRPGFEGAVGAMLGVAAVLRGATPSQ
jgi:hypothetical protein